MSNDASEGVEVPRVPRSLALLMGGVGGAVGWLSIVSVDFFWHLAAGRWMLIERAWPRVDPLRFTSESTPWVDHEWLFQVGLAVVDAVGGEPGLVLARIFLLAVTATALLALLVRAGAPPTAAFALTLWALMGSRPRFFLRPELASFALMVILLGLLARSDRPRTRGLLAGLVALWANLHPAALVAPVLAAAFWLGRLLQRQETGPAKIWPLLFPILCLNPWGWKIFRVPLEIRDALVGLRATNPDWAGFADKPQPGLVVFLVLLVLLVVAAWRRGGGIDCGWLLVTLALVPLAYASIRHQGFLLLAGSVLAADALGRGAGSPRLSQWLAGRRARAFAATAAIVCVLWCWFPPARGWLAPSRPWVPGLGVKPGLFPERAAAAIEAVPGLGNLYNSPPFGGYLLWRYFPPRRVFLDTRNEVHPELLRQVAAARVDARRWAELLDRWNIDGALLRYEGPRPVLDPDSGTVVETRGSSQLLFPCDDFGLVAWDEVAMFLVRRSPERTLEELCFRPDDVEWGLVRAAVDPIWRARVTEVVLEVVRFQPQNRRARAWLERLREIGVAWPAASETG